VTRLWNWFCDQVLYYEGSTRTAALLRISLALLMWMRFAKNVAPFTDNSPERLALAGSFYLSTTLMLFGVYSRLSTAWAGATALIMVFGFGPHSVEPWTHHHTTLLALSVALCAFTPCGHSYSWDRWMAIRNGDAPPPERAPLWGMRVIGFNVSIVYLATAWDKTFWGFLAGDRMEMSFQILYIGSEFPSMPGFEIIMMVTAVSTVALEYVLPFALWVRRWQWWAFPCGFALHGMIFILLPVGTFTVTIFALYLAYLDADDVHRWIDEMSGVTPATARR